MFTIDNMRSSPALDDNLSLREAAVISIAVTRGVGVLIDDMHGHVVAACLNHTVIAGTVGIIRLACQRGLIPVINPLLERLLASRHHLSEPLVQRALRRVGD